MTGRAGQNASDGLRVPREHEYVLTWEEPLQGEAKTNFSTVVGSAMFLPGPEAQRASGG